MAHFTSVLSYQMECHLNYDFPNRLNLPVYAPRLMGILREKDDKSSGYHDDRRYGICRMIKQNVFFFRICRQFCKSGSRKPAYYLST